MKILVAFPDDGHTGTYIFKTLRAMGNNVAICDPQYAFHLPNMINQFKPELIICSRTPQYIQGLILAKSKGVKIYCWNTDARGTTEDYQREFGAELIDLFKMCDTLYTVGLGEVEMFKEAGINAKHLPQGIYPKVDKKVMTFNGDDVPEKGGLVLDYLHDVSFLGGVDFYHEVTCSRTSTLREIYKISDINAEKAYAEQASEIYYRTKVNIGSNAYPKIEHCVSVRDYKIMGSGGFLLTSWQEGIEKHFEVGKELDCYKTPKEAREKVEYYLKNDKEREAIAQYGYEKAHREYKYEDRLETILKDFNNG